MIARAYVALWLVTLSAALVVALVPGGTEHVRSFLGLSLAPKPAHATDVGALWLHNAAALSPGFLGPLVFHQPTARKALWLVVLARATLAAGSVGVALGAYGTSLISHLVHVPFEWLAAAIALTRVRRPSAALVVSVLGVLAVAAVLEVCAT